VYDDSFCRLYVLDLEHGRFFELSSKPQDREEAVMNDETQDGIRTAYGNVLGNEKFIGPLEILDGLEESDHMASEICVCVWARSLCNQYQPSPVHASDDVRYRLYWEIRQNDVGGVE